MVHIAGSTGAIIGTAALLPIALLAGARALAVMDEAARVPVVEIALLRSIPHFRVLPTPVLEGLARVASRREFAPGQSIIRQGERGDAFYAIADGEVHVQQGEATVRALHRGEGFGEIALLRDVPRSASVVAAGPVIAYAVDGPTFVRVVTGHDATRLRAEAVATQHLQAGTGEQSAD
jgi:CRP-like cAMP-binding protein